MTDGGRGRRGAVVLLRRRHHVMRMGHNGLTWIVSRVMVRGRNIARLGEGVAGWSGARGIVLDGNRDEVAVLPCGDGRDSEGLLSERAGWSHVSGRLALRRSEIIVGGRGRLAVGVVSLMSQRRRDKHMGLGQVRWGHTEAVGHLRGGRKVERIRAAAGALAGPHVPVVDVSLQVSLGQIGAFATLNDTTHVERATLALFNPLDQVCTAVHV